MIRIDPGPPGPSETPADRLQVADGRAVASRDRVVTEEPLEIRLQAGGAESTVAVTMRTPGQDAELALGFLFSEGVIAGAEGVRRIRPLADPWAGPAGPSNVLAVELAGDALPDLARLERHFFATSACGVCGKAGIENLRLRGLPPPEGPPAPLDPRVIYALPASLRRGQGVFAATGGLHAAALFDAAGRLQAVREDVGRHNAVDKLVGWALLAGRLPLAGGIVLVSGRSSFEIVQKCLAAGAPVVCSLSAPSSLAVELARELGLTLVGFLGDRRFNVYAGAERLRLAEGGAPRGQG